MLTISKTQINSFKGDILSLKAESDSEKIICESSDPQIAEIKELGTGKYLVVLKNIGNTEIAVTSNNDTCKCTVSVREAKKSDPDGKFRIYVGDTHSHTSYSDGIATPYEVFKKVHDEEYFNFFTVTDHTDLEDDDEFFHTFDAADQYSDEGFTAFAGSESQINELYTNSLGRERNHCGEIVLINKEGYAYTDNREKFFELIGNNEYGLAIIAHPQIMGYTTEPAVWNSFDPEHSTDSRTLQLIHGVETFNETNDSNMINERAYSVYLDCGYKVSPYGASDHHGPRWGKLAESCRTFIYSQGASKELFLDAMINARTYSCENGNVKLFYTVNGKNPSTTLNLTDTYEFKIHAEPFYVKKDYDDTVYAEIVSDYGEVIASRSVGKLEYDFDITVRSDTARYFYIRLYSRIGELTVSSPVWTGREFDKYPKPRFSKKAFNDEDVRAKSWSGGNNAGGILSPDTTDYAQLNDPDGEVIIDLGRERTLSAIGYYSNQPLRNSNESYAAFMSRYEYFVSSDCINFTKVASGKIRLYGDEHIAEFEPCCTRYVKLRSLSTVGSEMRKEQYQKIGVAIGALRFYE